MFLNFIRLFLESTTENESFFNLIIKYFTDQNISTGVAIAYIVVTVLIFLCVIADIVIRLILWIKYSKNNRIESKTGKNNVQLAQELLQKAGLNDIQVKKASFIRAWIWGNSYSLTKRTIFLRRGIYNKSTITAIGLALQKVGIAKMCNDDSKLAKTRNTFQIIGLFGPFLFIPIVLLGLIIDLVLFNSLGGFSIGSIIVSLAILAGGFVVTLLNIPVEKKANNMALEMIKETKVLDEDETKLIKQVFDAYILSYILEFIITVLRIVQLILEIVMRVQSGSSSSKN